MCQMLFNISNTIQNYQNPMRFDVAGVLNTTKEDRKLEIKNQKIKCPEKHKTYRPQNLKLNQQIRIFETK